MAIAMVDNCHGCRWFGGISCGVRGDARIMKELGTPLHKMEPGEAHLLDGGFGGRLGSITPYPKPKKLDMPPGKAKANDGHRFLRARWEHVLTQLHNWGVWECGSTLPDRMQKLHLMVRAVVHIQQFLNVRNVRYEPYGPWDHFPSGIYGQPPATRRRGSDSDSDSDSDSSSSGSSLTYVRR